MEILFFLFIFFSIVTLVGHAIWVALAWFFRQFKSEVSKPTPLESLNQEQTTCAACGTFMHVSERACASCRLPRPTAAQSELLKELSATMRQLARLHKAGALGSLDYEHLMRVLEDERERLLSRATYAPQPTATETPKPQPTVIHEPEKIAHASAETETRAPSFMYEKDEEAAAFELITHKELEEELPPHIWASQDKSAEEAEPAREEMPVARTPRKPFSEVLAAFMEQSNIRWGEIIGGLLIIGCSTALVISLWNEIARVPVLKFIIFTGVTAALFGVGFYTEHRWKLPTTSRGILTIATLLVPLNFLAIAAVSSGSTPTGSSLVILSELLAPALFLCLVYFAGRVITRDWPHLLAGGVLGSSVGQLLVRHFAAPSSTHIQLLMLAAFPLACYLIAGGWMLNRAAKDEEITEGEANAIFITLGAATFAALLPVGLLLFKTGQPFATLMQISPLITLASIPLIMSGLTLHTRVTDKNLLATHTAGTSIAIFGALLSASSILLAWPNPASVAPAALFNFAVFTAAAILFEIPRAHLIAAVSFALFYLVGFHAAFGHVNWQLTRTDSLLNALVSIGSAQALTPLFVLFIAASEWLTCRARIVESRCYLITAGAIAFVSLTLTTVYGFGRTGDPYGASLIYAVYAAGAFWLAWRKGQAALSWIGSFLLLLTFAETLGAWLGVRFAWQAALLAQASVAAIAAIICERAATSADHRRTLIAPLNLSALMSSVVFLLLLAEARRFEPTAMITERWFWLSGVWLLLLWLNRTRLLFTAFQIALTSALLLTVKLFLQGFAWYAYLPGAWLHPWSLQIQGCVLVLLSLAWIALRLLSRKQSQKQTASASTDSAIGSNSQESWTGAAWRLLNTRAAFDQLVLIFVLCGFALLCIYGAWPGVQKELAARDFAPSSWNLAQFPHEHALEAGSWILLALLLLAMLLSFWERQRARYLLGALVALSTALPLLAGRFEVQLATASSWRWLAAIFLLLASIPLWFHRSVAAQLNSFGWPAREPETFNLKRELRLLLLLLTIAPFLLFTLDAALGVITYQPTTGPAAGLFYFIGGAYSYSIPLVLIALALIGHALSERAPHYAFAAGLFLSAALMLAELFAVSLAGGSMNRVLLAEVAQLCAIASAIYALLWLSTRARWLSKLNETQSARAASFFQIQIGISVAVNALPILPTLFKLFARPSATSIGTFQAGDVRGWLALILTALAAAWFAVSHQKRFRAGALFAFLISTGALVAFDLSHLDRGRNWFGFHAFLVASTLTAYLMLLARSLASRLETGNTPQSFEGKGIREYLSAGWQSRAVFWAVLGQTLVLMLSLRAAVNDPARPWWSVSALVLMSVLSACLQWQTLRHAHLYAAAVFFNFAAILWWATGYWNQILSSDTSIAEFLELNIVALSLPGIIWMLLEMRARRSQIVDSQPRLTLPAFHHLAAIVSLIWLACVVLLGGLLFDIAGLQLNSNPTLALLALASTSALMMACLWDTQGRYAVAGLYVLGLLAAAMWLDRLDLTPHELAWAGMAIMAAYAILTSGLWRGREQLMMWAARFGIPQRHGGNEAGLKWLRPFNALLVALVVLLSYLIVLTFAEWPLRLLAAAGVAGQALTFGLVAAGEKRAAGQRASVALFILGAAFFGWAELQPETSGTWLNRAVVLMIVMLSLIALYGVSLDRFVKRTSSWSEAVRRWMPWMAGACAVALVFVLSTEVFYQMRFGVARVNLLSLVTIAAALTSACVMCIVFAVRPARDPLKLSERGRATYVYLAEVLLALLFMHIRLTMPWLFTGFFERYWPLAVVSIAYVGVALSEALRRQGLMVLARPIERTGALLPLLPVLGFWALDSKVDFSALLFITGALYGGLSILRRSFAFGLLAALCGNGALWYALHRTDSYGLLQHPQLWLIPAALSVLIAAYLNRKRFTEDQMTSTHYIALMVIYASSTSDIFINGVANSPWLPLILAALSLAGVLCGITLRVRAFLFLGATFLLIAVTTMIWYASANLGWTWLWYVAGILTGALIIFTFALFEKKRGEVLRMVEDLKGWSR